MPIDRESRCRRNVAETRLADRIEQQREVHFRDCSKKGFSMTVAEDSWRPIGASIRERGLERIEEEIAQVRAEMALALSEFINGDGSRKRRRDDGKSDKERIASSDEGEVFPGL